MKITKFIFRENPNRLFHRGLHLLLTEIYLILYRPIKGQLAPPSTIFYCVQCICPIMIFHFIPSVMGMENPGLYGELIVGLTILHRKKNMLRNYKINLGIG